jgi:hypothetical protein
MPRESEGLPIIELISNARRGQRAGGKKGERERLRLAIQSIYDVPFSFSIVQIKQGKQSTLGLIQAGQSSTLISGPNMLDKGCQLACRIHNRHFLVRMKPHYLFAEHPAQQPAHAEETSMTRTGFIRVAGLLQRLVRPASYSIRLGEQAALL